MTPRVTLVWLTVQGNDPPPWDLGEVYIISAQVEAINLLIKQHMEAVVDAWLFWADSLPPSDPNLIRQLLTDMGDIWHGGLRLGMAGKPALIDMVAPTWTLNRDSSPDIEASSWRLSLYACLIRADVLHKLGGLAHGFRTLECAGLEFGHRCLTRGAIMKYHPALVSKTAPSEVLPYEDEVRFIDYGFGAMWRDWAILRSVLNGMVDLRTAFNARRVVSAMPRLPTLEAYAASTRKSKVSTPQISVSVIIPTLNRYSYLETILGQLCEQTILPSEIIVIDQTPEAQRDRTLKDRFDDIPLIVLEQETAGQCSARNRAIQEATGEYLLFIDDDDEVPPNLIEMHWRNLQRFSAEVSCGGVNEVGTGDLPPEFRYAQISSVFPTNNSMIRRDALHKSGLFDIAYDRTFMDDADLGMRLYLTGALMIYDPAIKVLHHHASSGGLRAYKQRTITYASSRARLTHRSLPSVSEIYFPLRYFTSRQVRESLWLRVLGTFSVRGGWIKKFAKFAISAVMLPHTLWVVWRRFRQAREMLRSYPQIPSLD